MPAIDIKRWIANLFDQLSHCRQRQLVVLRGPRDWCDARIDALSQVEPQALLFSNRDLGDGVVPLKQADSCLGAEARLVVVDLFRGFDPDACCIAGGLLRAGGILILLSPPLDGWDPHQDDYACWQDQVRSLRPRFAEYFFDRLDADDDIGLILTPQTESLAPPALAVLTPALIEGGQTAEQGQALQAIDAWLGRQQAAVLLLDAERGRGKSTCLGLLLKRLAGRPSMRCLVTASSRRAAAILLSVAGDVEFIAPDRLLQEYPAAELVVIDEAAMLPQSILRQICRRYPRVVMATTSDGYEGTGRGFMLRFVAQLQSRGLCHLRLQDPVRWCRGDRLEAWMNSCLLPVGEPLPADAAPPAMSEVGFALYQAPGQGENPSLLREVFALLNSAHYRTRPSDLRMLLENPDLVVIVASAGERVIGAALLNLEGGFDAALCEQVYLGQRRPRGHLLAQMLTAQAGVKSFAHFRGLRIQRIAVAEHCRRRGLGRKLIANALDYARQHELAWCGASFALDPETVAFWQRTGFDLVHVSYAAGKSSGSHSLAVLQSLEPGVEALIDQLRQRLQSQLATWMTQFLQTMDRDEVAALLRFAGYRAALNQLELAEVEAFARGRKGFELCFASLQRFVMQCIAEGDRDCSDLLVEKAVQNRAWRQLVRETGSEGREQLQRRLRGLVDDLLKAC